MLRPVTVRIKEASAIIVTEGDSWARLRERLDYLAHLLNLPIELSRNRESIQGCKQPEVEEEVQGVHMIVECLLEVDPIRSDLALCFSKHDAPSFLLPAHRAWKLWVKRSDEKQGER